MDHRVLNDLESTFDIPHHVGYVVSLVIADGAV
jgi:hypothetical protein